MNLFFLRERVVLQQGLDMLPAAQLTNSGLGLIITDDYDLGQRLRAASAKHALLDRRGLDLPAFHGQLAVRGDQSLRDIDAVALAFAETKSDRDTMLSRCGLDLAHLWGFDGKTVHHETSVQLQVYCAAPVATSQPRILFIDLLEETHQIHAG